MKKFSHILISLLLLIMGVGIVSADYPILGTNEEHRITQFYESPWLRGTSSYSHPNWHSTYTHFIYRDAEYAPDLSALYMRSSSYKPFSGYNEGSYSWYVRFAGNTAKTSPATVYIYDSYNYLNQWQERTVIVFIDQWTDYAVTSGSSYFTFHESPSGGAIPQRPTTMNQYYTSYPPRGEYLSIAISPGTDMNNYYLNTEIKALSYLDVTAEINKMMIGDDYIINTKAFGGNVMSYISPSPSKAEAVVIQHTPKNNERDLIYISSNHVSPSFYISEIGSSIKRWYIIPPEDESTIPDDVHGFDFYKINQPPHYIGVDINARININSQDAKDNTNKLVFYLWKNNKDLIQTDTYLRTGETFTKNGLGTYTWDELLSFYVPDQTGEYTLFVSVFNDNNYAVFNDVVDFDIVESVTSSFLTTEVRSGYDNSLIHNVNTVVSWGGVDRFDGLLLYGVYQANVPLGTPITISTNKTGYHDRVVTINPNTATTYYQHIMTPTSIEIPYGQGMATFTVLDSQNNPLHNVRFTLAGEVKYTNQIGKVSYTKDVLGSLSYTATLTGYKGVSGNIILIADEEVTKTIILLSQEEVPITEEPVQPEEPSIEKPSPSDGILSGLKYFFYQMGIDKESDINLMLALVLVFGGAVIVANITRDGLGAIVGASIGFVGSLAIGLIPLWILFVMFAIFGLYFVFTKVGSGGD